MGILRRIVINLFKHLVLKAGEQIRAYVGNSMVDFADVQLYEFEKTRALRRFHVRWSVKVSYKSTNVDSSE